MRFQLRSALPCLALGALALTACGYAPLTEPLDPVPEGELSFLVEDGVYDAHFVTVSNTCSDLRADVQYSTQVTSSVDGTPAFSFDGPSPFFGWSERWSSLAQTQYVARNPMVGTASTEVPETLEVVETTWVERAGPGWIELRFESVHEHCEHVGRLTLTLLD